VSGRPIIAEDHLWSRAPAPIVTADISEVIAADVVVVGAGLAGLSAALSAAQAGAQTVLLEKRHKYTARGMYIAAVGSRLQRRLGIDVDRYQALRDIIRWSGSRVKEELHWLWVERSGETMDWITDMAETAGLEVTMWTATYKGRDYFEYPVAHTVIGPSAAKLANMVDLAAVLEQNARTAGVNIQYKSAAAQLVRDGGGPVTGVIANCRGRYVRFEARRGIVLCTGDYNADARMVRDLCEVATQVDENVCTPPGVNTGDGHKMGIWIGATMQKSQPHAAIIHTQAGARCYCFLHVNARGERYSNEDKPGQSVCMSKSLQPGGIGWSVHDGRLLELLPRTLPYGGGIFWDQIDRYFGTQWDRALEARRLEDHLRQGRVVRADSIEELAALMSVPVGTFVATLARYNELARAGEDRDFGKRPELLFPIDTPPFYAGRIRSALLGVLGGLSVDRYMQPLDAGERPIPRLYAAGNVAGDFFAQDYPTIFPGHSHGRAVTFGRLAGQNAARNTP
jgi:fumarate reductase flavoprotein subunit